MASSGAVVIFSSSTCCMCLAVDRLIRGLGVGPTVYEIDGEESDSLAAALRGLIGGPAAVPAVFVGGRLVGTMEGVVAAHVGGALVPLLKEAGALWL
ncbi:Glutaredoxin-C8 [Striga hermonthica]|uniref:Glutaredoxin-C8 n=1 Tax=Striga hermonthica TaxID=68872 RepID=A0A9N7RBN6_STRHE|nr:Glutaredoxin-C8 [Striga hermonthica]